MSSFYDDASLVVIPSGYKTSKVYAEKPTDGSGDLTFTRTGDTATRVNSAGLIEKVRTNLATYSNDFSNGSWSKITDGTYSLVTESITDAFGNTSAVYKVTLLTGSFLVLRKTLASATTQTTNFSLYVKKTIGTTYVAIDVDDNTDAAAGANTNWQRISNTRATASFVDITTYSVGEPFYIFASQVELGDIATDYIPTTTAAVSVGPVANVPRLDYLGSTCGKLLLEPQRTNAFTFSEQFDNAAWTKYQATISANSAVSPDGYINADKLIDSTANDIHAVYRGYTFSANSTISFFVKAAEYSRIGIANLSDGGDVIFNLTTASVVSTSANFTNGKIESYGNGWYRISATTNGTSGAKAVGLYLVNNAGATTFTGTGTSGILIFGAQLEDSAAYATSYIPTLAASATRGADACSKTGISSLIGQTQGTIFVEEYYDASIANNGGLDDVLVALTDGTTNNLFLILHYGVAAAGYSNVVRFFIRNSNTTQAQFDSAALPTGTYKIALAYKNNDVVGYINGVQVGSDTSATIPATSVVTLVDPITLNAATKTVRNSQTLLFKTRLTNSELAELTSL